jgi:cytidylate kinase
VAPLRPADDAVIVDSTGMPITQVVETVLAVLPVSLQPR